MEVGIGSVVSGRIATFHPQAVALGLRQAQDERELCERDMWRLWKGPERARVRVGIGVLGNMVRMG